MSPSLVMSMLSYHMNCHRCDMLVLNFEQTKDTVKSDRVYYLNKIFLLDSN